MVLFFKLTCILLITEPRLVLSQKIVAKKEGCGPPEGSSIMPVPGSRHKIIFLLNSVEMCIFLIYLSSQLLFIHYIL